MNCGSRYFGSLARILRICLFSMMLEFPLMMLPVGLYLNGELGERTVGSLALR